MSRCRRIVLGAALAAAVAAAAMPARAQMVRDIRLVTSPTADVLPHGGYLIEGSLGPESSVLLRAEIGFFDRLMAGVSYGFQKAIGRGEIAANDLPGFELRVRVLDETAGGPAIALGVDTQGEDQYLEGADRYVRKSKGAYAVVSKNYRLIGDFSIHGGVNYSFENKDEGGVNAFAGLSLDIYRGFGALLDYDAALDDNDTGVATHLTRGRGYLDAGLFLDYGDNLKLEFLFRDLRNNYLPESGVERAIAVYYFGAF